MNIIFVLNNGCHQAVRNLLNCVTTVDILMVFIAGAKAKYTFDDDEDSDEGAIVVSGVAASARDMTKRDDSDNDSAPKFADGSDDSDFDFAPVPTTTKSNNAAAAKPYVHVLLYF